MRMGKYSFCYWIFIQILDYWMLQSWWYFSVNIGLSKFLYIPVIANVIIIYKPVNI